MKMKFRIRTKYLFIFAFIVLFNVFATYILSNNYIEDFYRYKKMQQIESIANEIITLKQENPTDRRPWYSYVTEMENQYYEFLIFDYVDMHPSVLYYSKSSIISNNSKSYQYWINDAISKNVFVTFQITPSQMLSINDKDSLYLYVKLDTNQYLFISTRLEYIQFTSRLATEFYSYVSLISLVIAFGLIVFVTNRITKPITKLSKITKKISNFQFDEKCEVNGNDEIAQLAANINAMSDKIEENLNLLIENNEVLKKDIEMKEQNATLRRQFISNVSHDFKTPLALIQAYSEILIEDDNNKETLEIIVTQVKQMNILVNQLLSLNQLESGLIALEKSFFSINEIINDVLRSIHILLVDKNLQYEFISDDDYIVEGDYQRIHQVIQNLIENAVKYTPENEAFKIEIKKNFTRVEINISNKAPDDMNEETLNHLFDSFYMTEKSRNTTIKSYGLGLAIVKATMDLHEQNCGARLENGYITFFITLDIYSLLDDEDDEDSHVLTI